MARRSSIYETDSFGICLEVRLGGSPSREPGTNAAADANGDLDRGLKFSKYQESIIHNGGAMGRVSER